VLLLLGRRLTLWHWLAAPLGAYVLAILLSALMDLLINGPESVPTVGQVPHRGMALTTAVLGFFAVMLAKDLGARRRKWPYLVSAVLVAVLGFSHYYLGLASLAGLLAGIALAMGWTALVGIAYRSRSTSRRRPVWLSLAFYSLIVVVAIVHARGEVAVRLDATRLAQPDRSYFFLDWQDEGWRQLPDRVTRLGRHHRSRFDFQVAANLNRLAEQLADEGWLEVEAGSGAALWSLLLGSDDIATLPHLSRDFAGRPDDLVMRREAPDGSVYLARLWSSGARLEPGGVPIWLGQVRQVQPVRQLVVLSRWDEIDDAVTGPWRSWSWVWARGGLAVRRRGRDSTFPCSTDRWTGRRPAVQPCQPAHPDVLPGRSSPAAAACGAGPAATGWPG